jgi:hypothetical protein
LKIIKHGGKNGKGEPVYTEHMNVKLTKDQAAAIRASGEGDSPWIRDAVQMRLDAEGINDGLSVLQ